MSRVAFSVLLVASAASAGCPEGPAPISAEVAEVAEVADVTDVADVADVSVAADAARGTDASAAGDAVASVLPTIVITLTELASLSGGDPWAWASVAHPLVELHPQIEVLRVGDCVFSRPKLEGLCDQPCVPPEFCSPLTDRCATHPPRLDAGPIGVDGLEVGLVLEPTSPRGATWFYYSPAFSPEPVAGGLFGEGDMVRAHSGGGPDVGPFSVEVAGVADLTLGFPCELTPVAGEELVVTWTPAAPGSVVHFVLQSANHGGMFSEISCETADSGELIVDSALVSLYLADWHPVESWRIARSREAATVTTGARVVLRAEVTSGCMLDLE